MKEKVKEYCKSRKDEVWENNLKIVYLFSLLVLKVGFLIGYFVVVWYLVIKLFINNSFCVGNIVKFMMLRVIVNVEFFRVYYYYYVW